MSIAGYCCPGTLRLRAIHLDNLTAINLPEMSVRIMRSG